jgi:membrane-associated phospholipid phosphatase
MPFVAPPTLKMSARSPVPLWCWLLVFALLSADGLWLAITPLSLSLASYWTLLGVGALGGGLTALPRFLEIPPRVQNVCAGFGLMAVAWPALRLFNHLTMASARPYADASLAQADALLGFNWLGYCLWIDHHPIIANAMELTYTGLSTYSTIAFFAINFLCRIEDATNYLKLFLITATTSMIVGAYFPAKAAALFYRPDAHLFAHTNPYAGAYHVTALRALKTNPQLVLDLQSLPGLVTFPSFHTAMGLIIIWSCRRNWALFAGALLINGLMIASTPLYGSHYMIDLIGGGAVAALAIAGLNWLGKYQAARGFHPWPADPQFLR